MIYLIVFLLTLYGVFALDQKGIPYTSSQYKFVYRLTILLMILVPGLSYRIGIDTPSYMREFIYYDTLSTLSVESITESFREPLWVVFASICKTVIDNFAFMHIINATIFTGVIVFFSNRLTSKRFWPLLFYLICYWVHFNFGALREALAMSCFLLGLYTYFKNDNFWVFILYGVAATLFHKFAFVIVIATFATLMWNRNKILCLFLLISLSLFFIVYGELLLQIVWHSTETFDERVSTYVGMDGFSIVGIFANIITRVVPPYLIMVEYKRESFTCKNKIISILILAIGVGITSSFIPLLDRFYNYLFPVIAIAFANLVGNNIASKLSRIILYSSIFLLFFFNINNFYRPSTLEYRSNIRYNAAYFPYYSIFTMEEDPIREGLPRR